MKTDFRPVLDRFAPLDLPGQPSSVEASGLEVRALAGGLINDTYELGDAHVLQRLHRIFRPQVNLDIAALTPVLARANVPVPTLCPTHDDELFTELDEPEELVGVWRIMTRLPGRTIHRIQSPGQADAVGAMLGRFHTALLETDHTFAFVRRGAHDTNLHMTRLWRALDALENHRLWAGVSVVAEGIFDGYRAWGDEPELPKRIIHGDPKVSNFLFGGDDQVLGVIDLDTMAWGTLDAELGDACRSWCASEETAERQAANLATFEASMTAYLEATAGWITKAELAALPGAAERISLELAARFAADALREEYFGWDPAVAPTRGDHNLIRATNQLALARDLRDKRGKLEAIVLAAR